MCVGASLTYLEDTFTAAFPVTAQAMPLLEDGSFKLQGIHQTLFHPPALSYRGYMRQHVTGRNLIRILRDIAELMV